MVIEESILIKADIATIWDVFTDLTCWKEWNTVARDVASDSGRMKEGSRFRFCLRPFAVPVHLDPVVDEVVEQERVVWSGSKFGIASRHEFLFQQAANGVLLTSREEFRGIPLLVGGRPFTAKIARDLASAMLQELKAACEHGS